MQAVLFASGLNTRVRHLHPDLPKAMFPLGNRPYLDYYIETLFKEGVDEIIIVVYHLAHVIRDYFSDRPEMKTGKIKIVKRKESHGPVGALVAIETLLQDRFYCDILFKADLKAAFSKLGNSKIKALTFLTKDEFGMWDDLEAQIDEANQLVTDFNPGAYSHENGWMDVGQVYKKDPIIAMLKRCPPENEHFNLSIWPELMAKNQLTYHKVGPVFDIGTEKNYGLTKKLFTEKRLDALNS